MPREENVLTRIHIDIAVSANDLDVNDIDNLMEELSGAREELIRVENDDTVEVHVTVRPQ